MQCQSYAVLCLERPAFSEQGLSLTLAITSRHLFALFRLAFFYTIAKVARRTSCLIAITLPSTSIIDVIHGLHRSAHVSQMPLLITCQWLIRCVVPCDFGFDRQQGEAEADPAVGRPPTCSMAKCHCACNRTVDSVARRSLDGGDCLVSGMRLQDTRP
jgi:hypothetical protein